MKIYQYGKVLIALFSFCFYSCSESKKSESGQGFSYSQSSPSTSSSSSSDQSNYMQEQQRIEQDRLAREQQAEREREEQQLLAYRESINQVLLQDATIGHEDNSEAQASGMRNISLFQCPPEFIHAYNEHVLAWESLAKIDKEISDLKSDENIGLTLIESGVEESLSPIKDAADKLKSLKYDREIASDKVRTTFTEVERVAEYFGVRPNTGVAH
jgi:hypothetical protein